MRGQVSDLVRYPQGGFRRLRAATFFFHGEKEGKTPPGTAPDEHFVLIVAFPRTPNAEVTPWGGQKISGAQKWSGFSLFNPGHWALGLQKLPLVRFHTCAWVCRTNTPGPFPTVGAALAAARKPSPYKGEGAERMRGG